MEHVLRTSVLIKRFCQVFYGRLDRRYRLPDSIEGYEASWPIAEIEARLAAHPDAILLLVDERVDTATLQQMADDPTACGRALYARARPDGEPGQVAYVVRQSSRSAVDGPILQPQLYEAVFFRLQHDGLTLRGDYNAMRFPLAQQGYLMCRFREGGCGIKPRLDWVSVDYPLQSGECYAEAVDAVRVS